MNIAIMLVTHPGIGPAMQTQAQQLLKSTQLHCVSVEIHQDDHPQDGLNRIQDVLEQMSEQQCIMLTDIYGATPCNLAIKAAEAKQIPLIHGLNLAMLLRAYNYASLPRAALIEKITDGGKQAIFINQP